MNDVEGLTQLLEAICCLEDAGSAISSEVVDINDMSEEQQIAQEKISEAKHILERLYNADPVFEK